MLHYKLFSKLLQLGTPVYHVKILVNWYAAQSLLIKCDNSLSEPVNVCNGVQGSVLSFCLFNAYMNDLLGDLRNLVLVIGNMFLGVSLMLMICCLFLLLLVCKNDGYL